MDVKLKKPYKNHPAGAVLASVSSDILNELAKLKVIDVVKKKSKKKAMAKPKRNKMAISPETETNNREAKKPPLPFVRIK